MKRRRLLFLWTFILLLLAALGVVGGAFKVRAWIAIDRCLDAGGSWNHETKHCEY